VSEAGLAGLTGGGALGEVPYLRPHPGAAALFARRAGRLAALAPGHAAGDYLALLSRLCAARQINISTAVHFGKQKGESKDQYTRPQDRIAGGGGGSSRLARSRKSRLHYGFAPPPLSDSSRIHAA